jgi:hypothetical protein
VWVFHTFSSSVVRNCSDGSVDERESRAKCSISILNSTRIKKTNYGRLLFVEDYGWEFEYRLVLADMVHIIGFFRRQDILEELIEITPAIIVAAVA